MQLSESTEIICLPLIRGHLIKYYYTVFALSRVQILFFKIVVWPNEFPLMYP